MTLEHRHAHENSLEGNASIRHAGFRPSVVDGPPLSIRDPGVDCRRHPGLEQGIPLAVDQRVVGEHQIRGVFVALIRRSESELLGKFDRLVPPAVFQHELLAGAFQEGRRRRGRRAVLEEGEEFGVVGGHGHSGGSQAFSLLSH